MALRRRGQHETRPDATNALLDDLLYPQRDKTEKARRWRRPPSARSSSSGRSAPKRVRLAKVLDQREGTKVRVWKAVSVTAVLEVHSELLLEMDAETFLAQADAFYAALEAAQQGDGAPARRRQTL